MKQLVYKLMMGFILAAGFFVGILKGQEARHKWVNKMKVRFAENKEENAPDEVMLDEIEMSAFHSN